MTVVAPATPDASSRPLIDFGRGSREQSQGGASKDNVHPIRERAATLAPGG